MTKKIPLSEVAAAVHSAVEKALKGKDAISADQIFIGFVAPIEQATQENAEKLVASFGLAHDKNVKAAVGPAVESPATGGGAPRAEAIIPHRTIGLIYVPAKES